MECPVFNLFARCCCFGGIVCAYCIQLTIITIMIVLGALIAWKPKKTIGIQITIYRYFNWKVEPISMEKEIKNTRIMGFVVLILSILSLSYILLMQASAKGAV